MVDMDSAAAKSDLGSNDALARQRREEIKAIREWSHAVEINPYAFGPSIDKQRAIKLLIEELDSLTTARQKHFDEAIELVSTQIPVGDKSGPFINSDQIKAVIAHMKKLRDDKEKG